MTKEDHPKGLERYFREPVNGLTHLAGIVLSIIGLVTLLVLSEGEPWRTASFAVYGATLILLYTASTLLHSLRAGPKGRRYLKLFDHAAIFLLIAGSYTPITLVTLQEGYATLGWTLFGIAWGVALLGVIFKLVWLEAPRWLSTGLYLLMGWLALIAIVPIIQSPPCWRRVLARFGRTPLLNRRSHLWPQKTQFPP